MCAPSRAPSSLRLGSRRKDLNFLLRAKKWALALGSLDFSVDYLRTEPISKSIFVMRNRNSFSLLIFILAVTAFEQGTAEIVWRDAPNMGDFGIVVDQVPIFGSQKANLIHNFVVKLVNTVIDSIVEMKIDVKFAVVLRGVDKNDRIVTFDEGVDVAAIKNRVTDGLAQMEMVENANPNYDSKQIAADLWKTIKTNPGNRPEAPDFLFWIAQAEPFNVTKLRSDAQRLMNLNSGPDLLVACRNFASFIRSNEPSDGPGRGNVFYIFDKYYLHSRQNKDEPQRDNWANDLDNLKKKVQNAVRVLFDTCKSQVYDTNCYFDQKLDCKFNHVYEEKSSIAQMFKKYCATGTVVGGDCPKDKAECQRLCDEAAEWEKESKECDAPCDGQGFKNYRPKDSATDPMLANCPWKPEKCNGTKCSTSIVTTPKTTTKPKKMETWLIIIIFLAVVASAAILMCLILFCILKKKGGPRYENFRNNFRRRRPTTINAIVRRGDKRKDYDRRRAPSPRTFDRRGRR